MIVAQVTLAQASTRDSVDIYISRLNWKSFGFSSSYVPKPYLFHDGNRLVFLSSNNKVKKLIACLNNPTKTVAIHMVLTQMFEPDSSSFSQSYIYLNDKSIKAINYKFNGLSWIGYNSGDSSSISKKQVNAIKKFWKKRVYK